MIPVLLRTTGGLWLAGEGLPPACAQRRRLALLALLARAPEGRVSRDKLYVWLWPESSGAKARHALDQLVYATRRDLGRAAIVSTDGQVQLDESVVQADCREFERLYAEGQLERAVEQYGGPFLDGFHLGGAEDFERWVEEERSTLARRFAAALERLARVAEERGEMAAAVQWWRRLSDVEPLDGRLAAALVRALAAAGDVAGALQQADAHARLVRAELGIAPDARLAALTRELKTGTVAPEAERITRAAAGPARLAMAGGGIPMPAMAAGRVHARGQLRFTLASGVAALLAGLVVIIGLAGLRGAAVGAGSGGNDVAPPAPAAADSAAESLYLHGRIAWSQRTRSGLEEAVVLFRRATERDPKYAEAYAGLADAYVLLGYHGYLPGDASFPKGKAAAQRALALDPRNAAAYASLGMALEWEKRWPEAERSFRKAIATSPGNATAHQWYALLLTILGRNREALVQGRRAAELDPLSIQIHNTYGIMLLNVGALDSALHVYERIVTNEPDSAWVRQNPWVLDNFGLVAADAGRYEQALGLNQQAVAAVPGHPRALFHLATTYLTRGHVSEARAAFARADSTHAHYALYRAMLHAQLGELDSAFEWLGRVQEWGLPTLQALVNDPALRKLRADPRYPPLRRLTGLPEPALGPTRP